METNSKSIYSMTSYNDLTFQTLNPQGVYNSVSLLPITTNRTLYNYYNFRKNLCAILSAPVWKHVSNLLLGDHANVQSTLLILQKKFIGQT